MSAEQNRAVVLKFYETMAKQDFKAMFDLMADDATWTVAGKPEQFAPAGVHSKASRKHEFDNFVKFFKSMAIDVISTTAEGDRVCIEFHSKNVTHTNRKYENEMLCLHRLRDGKIVNIYEHVDQGTTLAFMKVLKDAGEI
jgi:ketosteroid isomerase-like protein